MVTLLYLGIVGLTILVIAVLVAVSERKKSSESPPASLEEPDSWTNERLFQDLMWWY